MGSTEGQGYGLLFYPGSFPHHLPKVIWLFKTLRRSFFFNISLVARVHARLLQYLDHLNIFTLVFQLSDSSWYVW